MKRDKFFINSPLWLGKKEKAVADSLDVNRYARINTTVAAHSGAVTRYPKITWPNRDWRLGFLFGALAAFGLGVSVGAWLRTVMLGAGL